MQSRKMQSRWSRAALAAGLALTSLPALVSAEDAVTAGRATTEVRQTGSPPESPATEVHQTTGAPRESLTTEVHQTVALPERLLTRFGEYFLAGGGVTNYIDGAVRSKVDLGGTWDVRLGFGNHFHVGVEAAYVGSARQSGTVGSNLVTNGAEGVVRVQYPYLTGNWLVEPFGFGGAGWTRFDLNSALPGVRSADDVFVIPFGGGIDLAYAHVLLDARFTYRQTFDEALLKTAVDDAPSLASWAVTASLGYEF